ncbi:hypothetical protein DIS17_10715 [Levilactobacillus brevis]|uniref:Uncharacterized protein n=1 Tax=Levilactobacillus brevis TaxID=1580 RepID=A0AAJ5FH74_LEVBR|nr:hypothetical protein [Levilactobacillus brevis]TOZ02346.1 hypothetical protein DIS17_10715 [Levilactobacillus brevis]
MDDLQSTWKLSELAVFRNIETGYSIKGNLVNNTKNETFLVPFGAIDANYQLAYDKSLSELCERATWLNMYKVAPKLITNTIGFAAHTLTEAAIYQSTAEQFERQCFRTLIEILNQQRVNEVLTTFSVVQWSRGIDFLRTTKICGHLLYLVIRTLCTSKRVYFGMGKASSLAKSRLDALGECRLVQESLEKLDVQNNIKDGIMSSGDINYFKALSESASIKKSMHILKNYENKTTDLLKQLVSFGEDTITVDVSKYMPDFLNPLKRVVYYSFPKNRSEQYIQNFLVK